MVLGVSWSSSNRKWPPMALTLVGYFTPSPQRAMSIVPEPMPVVMKSVGGEFMLRRGPQPKIVVYALGNRRHRLAADGIAPFEAQAAGHVDVANQTRPHLLYGIAPDGRALLRSVLNHAIV